MGAGRTRNAIVDALALDGDGPQWSALCPAHPDSSPSLSVKVLSDGRTLLKCHVGCATKDIVTALGCTMRDLTGEADASASGANRIEAEYPYLDQAGALLYQVVRFSGKNFLQRRPDGSGGWIWNTKDVTRVPYRLPEILEAIAEERRVLVVEGEKDVDLLWSVGVPSTTNCCGADQWTDSHADFLRGAHVAIVPDNDDCGERHALKVARSLVGRASEIRIVRLSGLGAREDVSDWFARGGTREELERLVSATPVWEDAEQPGFLLTSRRYKFLEVAQLLSLPAKSWLVEGIVPASALVMPFGPPGSYKSFACFDLALSVATGRDWQGHRVEQGDVVYVAAEGSPSEVARRVRAWLDHHGIERASLYVLTAPVDLASQDAVEAFLRELPCAPKAVVIDTLSRCTPGLDENRTADMTRVIQGSDRIREATGATVFLVHHSRKHDATVRGSSVLEAAVDTMIGFTRRRKESTVRVTCAKQKDAAEFPEFALRLVESGGSAILQIAAKEANASQLSVNDRRLLDALPQDGSTSAEWHRASMLGSSSYHHSKKRLLDDSYVELGKDKVFRRVAAGSLNSSVSSDGNSS